MRRSIALLAQQVVDIARHDTSGKHPLEGLVHIGLRRGLAQLVFIGEPDVDDDLDRARCKAGKQPTPIWQTLLHVPPVRVVAAQHRAEAKVRCGEAGLHRLRQCLSDASSSALP